MEQLRTQGEQAIVEEVTRGASDPIINKKDEFGWTDLDWLCYITGSAKPEAQNALGGEHTPPPSPPIGSADGEIAAPAVATASGGPVVGPNGKLIAPDGVDEGRSETKLSFFAALPTATAAGLTKAHVLALRLYSSTVSRNVNMPLHDGCSPDRPHPYPALVIQLIDALPGCAPRRRRCARRRPRRPRPPRMWW